MNSPFYQPARQNFSSSQSMQQPQGGFGVQTAGTFGGFQPQPSFSGNIFGGGFGGGFQPQQQSFGGFGGGQGFGGFNPFQGGFGGFQQQQQFNPYQGGFGGGFNPYQGGFQPQQQQFNPFQGGYGGMPQQGFSPMFGGIGGLGFNPMMGPQFGMPMPGFNPYQQQFQPQFNQRQNVDSQGRVFVPDAPLPEGMVGTMGGTGYDPVTGRVDLGRAGGSGTYVQPQSPFTGPQRSAQDILSMAVGKTPQDMQYDLNKDGKISSADALAYHRQYGAQPQTPQTPQMPIDSGMNRGVDNMSIGPGFGSRQPMYGGIGGLGFNPMMGPQFGMPMQGFNPYQSQMMSKQQLEQQQFNVDQTPVMGDMMYRGGPPTARDMEFRRQRGQDMRNVMDALPLSPEQKYQQAQQYGTQQALYANSPTGRMAAERALLG